MSGCGLRMRTFVGTMKSWCDEMKSWRGGWRSWNGWCGNWAARTERLDQAYSMQAEEQRQGQTAGSKRRWKQKSSRRGRVTTQEKLDRADRTEIVLPEGFTVEECRLISRRHVWRIESGRAVLVAYGFIAVRRDNGARWPVCCRGASSASRY